MDNVQGGRLKVLVVDDDPATLRLVVRIVTSAGYHVAQAENGRQALKAILSEDPDLVICDWDMPELDGVELCRTIRQETLSKYVYFLLLTAKAGTDHIIEGLAAGADDFVSKPINKAVFLARLRAAARLLETERKLRWISRRDPLTDALNRRAFSESLTQEWDRSARYHAPLSCVMLDLDFFKSINDTHGHTVGDSTLKAVADLLDGLRRSSDVLCRYGGEEFCLLMPETDEAGASRWAERTRVAISQAAIPVKSVALQVTASFGVAQRLGDTATPERLMQLADEALSVAKQSGRNRVVRFSSLQEPLPQWLSGRQADGPLSAVAARDVMSTIVLCPHRRDTVQRVAELFLQLRINSAPVVDDDGKVVGMVTEADLMTRTALGKGWDEPVENIMGTDVACCDEETSARETYEFLARVSVPRVVVVRQGRPTGVICRATFLRWFRNWTFAREEAAAGCRCDSLAAEREARKTGILKTAEAAVRRAAEIPRRIAGVEEDFVPCVVAEATRLQDLANDLLMQCRSACTP